jgi:hypothetical protein
MSRLSRVLLSLGVFCCARAEVAVLTQHNDLARTGANLNETVLNTSNVNPKQFGLVFTREVDDQIYAQPLVMTNVNLGAKGRHNLLIAATVNDSVYAFDADDPSQAQAYWQVNFLGPDIVAPRNDDMTGACGGEYSDFSGKLGIVGTPVIAPGEGTLYLVARTKEHGTNFVQRLHALDLRTGAERPNSPVVITATYPGHGHGSIDGILKFDSQRQNPRSGLALVNGVVYIAWASHCDWGPYHGWLIGYDGKTLRQEVVYNTTPDGGNGGIWMSGQGPAADSEGNLFVCTGNGTVGTHGDPADPIDRGESFLKLTRHGASLQLTSWFTPCNWQDLENTDNDFGNSGPVLIPGTHLAFSGSKEGRVYLINRDSPGGLSRANTDTNIVQTFQVGPAGASAGLFGAPVWWDGPEGSYAYLWCRQDFLRQYRFDPAKGIFILPEFARGPVAQPAPMPGGILAISANGRKAGTGILWATQTSGCDGNHNVCPGILRACDAQNVANELWNSEQVKPRDAVGNLAKFVPPTVANGKVYLATFSNRLNVYGLLPGQTKPN